MTYTLADWNARKSPPKGWDVADAIADGWSADELKLWMRALLSDSLSYADPPKQAPSPAPPEPPPRAKEPPAATAPPPPPRKAPAPAPANAKIGAAGVASIDGPFTQAVANGSDVELARLLAAQLRIVCEGPAVMADGAFWAWGPTAWTQIEDRHLRMAVHHFDNLQVSQSNKGLNISKGKIDGVIHETGTLLSRPDFFNNPAIALNALNVVITLDENGKVGTREHSPDDRFRFTIPAEFNLDTDMTPPPGSMLYTLLEGAFLGDVDANEKKMLIGEILGAAAFGLATRMPQPKAFVLLGETASNGKSTIASLLSCLLPEGSVSAIKPGDFSDPARIVNLAGKAANVVDEISGAVAGEAFKAAVTGNAMEGRDLYRSAMTFVPRAIHVYTTNKLPTFNGGLDRGLQRRLVVLTFNRPIPKSEVIADIAERIKRDELDILLGFALAGAIRLVKNKNYTIPQSAAEALRGWLLLDPINEWFEAKCKAIEDEPSIGWPAVRLLFADFKSWAVDQGHNERNLPTVNNFSQRLKTLPGATVVRRSYGSIAKGITCDFSSGTSASF